MGIFGFQAFFYYTVVVFTNLIFLPSMVQLERQSWVKAVRGDFSLNNRRYSTDATDDAHEEGCVEKK